MDGTKKLVFLAILTSLSVVLGVVDSQISVFLAVIPGAKIGLANITIILAILYFRFSDSFTMAFLKSLLIGLILGAVSTFVIGFSGTLLSFLGMYVVIKLSRNAFSMVGVSVIGGVLHAIGQITAVTFFYSSLATLLFVPQLVFISAITGVGTGLITNTVIRYIENAQIFPHDTKE
jgi:heptaprenyl diphosphate synthase